MKSLLFNRAKTTIVSVSIIANCLLPIAYCFSQGISINTTGNPPDTSAILDVASTNKGLLIPRMTTTQRDNIVSPALSLMIFNITDSCLQIYSGVNWENIYCLGDTACITPSIPGAITGNDTVCSGTIGEPYSIAAVSGADSYNWTVPSGATVASGQGTTSITVDFSSASDNVSVTASNDCDTSAASNLAVTVNSVPPAPVATAGSGATETQITANWNASSGATSYALDVSGVSNFASFIAGYNNLNVGNVTTKNVIGLTCATTYYYRLRAENNCGTSGNSDTITLPTAACFICGTTVNDIEGNTYNTLLIGSQCWLKENMRTTTYPDGSSITKGPSAHGAAGWTADSAYYSCPPIAANTAEDCPAKISLGMLYQWSAAMDGDTTEGAQGVCPTGWHVPTDAELKTLEGSLGMTVVQQDLTGWRGTNEGSKMADHVTDQTWTADNLTGDAGFGTSGLDIGPSGWRNTNGEYFNRGTWTSLWSSTVSGAAWRRSFIWTRTDVLRDTRGKAYGFSVRCVKD